LGHCPEGAISIVEREAEPYDERKVMANIVKQGPATVEAHLRHLKEHGQHAYLKEALTYLQETGVYQEKAPKPLACGCPGQTAREFPQKNKEDKPAAAASSELSHWPIQLHLISPRNPAFQGADLLLAADCTAFAFGAFHGRLLKGKKLTIACPKLDEGQEEYREKLVALIDEGKINSLTVIIMEVPCCRGLLVLARKALEGAKRKIPLKLIVVGVEGNILSEEWV
jgi:hypothetical protein